MRALLEEFEDGSGDCDLANPEEEHPLDHFRLEFGTILLGHEPLREVFLLLAKGHFEDREDFDRAYEG